MLISKIKSILTVAITIVSLSMAGCGGKGTGLNPQLDGIVGPDVELVNGNLILSMAFENVQIEGGLTMPIPKYPTSSLSVGPDFLTGGLLLVLTISASDLAGNGFNTFDPQTLPGGRPLPGGSR